MPQKVVMKGIVACLLLLTATYRPCAASIRLTGIIRHPHRTKVQVMCIFPGQPYAGMTVTVRRRLSKISNLCRLSMTTCTDSINFYMLGPSSVTGFTSEGSVVYTLYQASCRDTGEYVCETAYSKYATVRNGGVVVDKAILEMHVGSAYMDASPPKIPAANLLSGTQMSIGCFVYTTISLQESCWTWQTRRSANESWMFIPKIVWNVTATPSPETRCNNAWRSTLVVHMSKSDLGREYRCLVAYVYKGRYFQSKPGTFVIEAGQPLPVSRNARRALYIILIVAFGAALFVLGIVLVVIARSTDLTQIDRWIASLRHRCCLRYLLSHRRRRHSTEHRGSGEQPQDSPEVNPPSGGAVPVVGAAGEAEASVFSPRAGVRQVGQKDLKKTTSHEDDAPGAEDDALEFHLLGNDGPACLPKPLRSSVSQTTYVLGGETGGPPPLASPQDGAAPGKTDSCVASDDVMTISPNVIKSCAVTNEAAKSDISVVGSGVELKGTTRSDMKSTESVVASSKELAKPNVKSSPSDVTTTEYAELDAVSATSTQKSKQGKVRGGGTRLARSPSCVTAEPHRSPTLPRAPSLVSPPSQPLTHTERECQNVGSLSETDGTKSSCSSTSKVNCGKTQHLSEISTTVTPRQAPEETKAPIKGDSFHLSEEHKVSEDLPCVYTE